MPNHIARVTWTSQGKLQAEVHLENVCCHALSTIPQRACGGQGGHWPPTILPFYSEAWEPRYQAENTSAWQLGMAPDLQRVA